MFVVARGAGYVLSIVVVIMEDSIGAESLARRVRGSTFGSTRVAEVTASIDRDSEDAIAVFLDITLDDPDDATWPTEDIVELRRFLLRGAAELELGLTIYLRLSPHTDSPQDDELVAQ